MASDNVAFRRRPRMRVILPQPLMEFRFRIPKQQNHDNLDDHFLDKAHHQTLTESDACSGTTNPSQGHLLVPLSQVGPRLNKNNSSASSSKTTSYFDCNLCFRSERQPVVTACGHLYCYSCLCDWLRFDQSCTVCEAEVRDGHIFPIYRCSGARPKAMLQLV